MSAGSEGREGFVRVLFDVEDESSQEALWGEPVAPGVVKLDNVPLLTFGVSRGDAVRVTDAGEQFRFAGVAERGGHSTYRIMLTDADSGSVQERLASLLALGCGSERFSPRFLALDVPPNVSVVDVYALLEQGLDAGDWTFEEGHCGHPL